MSGGMSGGMNGGMGAALARAFTLLLLPLALLGGCSTEPPVRIGAKNFAESQLLAHMLAELARERGFDGAAVLDYPDTQSLQEALKQGAVDAYPEYNGTGLVMLGQNPTSDGDEATRRVEELYEPLGMTWLPRLGFANTYGLAMRPERAEELGIESIGDLAAQADSLALGIEDDFAKRPLDGFPPLQQRYGIQFDDVEIVPLDERATLYDRLLDGEADIIEVYTTDGQIADYGLTVLEDDLEFFSIYEAAVLARTAALSEHPGLAEALGSLEGTLDETTIRDLNRKVEIEGRSPQAVARDALARLDLIDGGSVETEEPLLIAASPLLGEGGAANATLRSARAAFEGRDVRLDSAAVPLARVADGTARIALVGADELFDLSGPAPVRDERFEALAPLGQNLLHLVARADGPARLDAATAIATGPAGSSSERLARLMIAGLGLSADLVPAEAAGIGALLERVADGEADIAVLPVPEGDPALRAALDGSGFRLLGVGDWNAGSNLVRYPFLRQARIAAETYPGQREPVETLGVQLVLAGPAPDAAEVIGDQGPSSIQVGLSPISDAAVTAMNETLPDTTLIDPTLRIAAALAPAIPTAPAAMNPATDISILNVAVVLLFIALIWLYIRPEHR